MLSPSQYDDWQAFYELYPFGDDTTHVMLARLCCMWGSAESKIEDFIPGTRFDSDYDPDDPFQVSEQVKIQQLREEALQKKERLAAQQQDVPDGHHSQP